VFPDSRNPVAGHCLLATPACAWQSVQVAGSISTVKRNTGCRAVGVDLSAAACLPIAFGTAHLALIERARVQQGQVVLVLGAGGGVGIAAVQVCAQKCRPLPTMWCASHFIHEVAPGHVASSDVRVVRSSVCSFACLALQYLSANHVSRWSQDGG
jgi:hypothetical protein